MLTRLATVASMFLASVAVSAQPRPSEPCCRIIAISARTGIAMVRNNSSGKTFLIGLKDRTLRSPLKLGMPVAFSERSGVSILGTAAGAVRIIKPPKGGGGSGISVDIDCSITPEACPGAKPAAKLTMDGATTWEDVIDYCYDEIDNCIGGT